MREPKLNIYDIYYIVHLSDKAYDNLPIRATNLKSTFCAKLVNFGNGRFYFEREEGGMIIIDYAFVDFMAPSREHCAPGGLVS
jgi:hypothetical protein